MHSKEDNNAGKNEVLDEFAMAFLRNAYDFINAYDLIKFKDDKVKYFSVKYKSLDELINPFLHKKISPDMQKEYKDRGIEPLGSEHCRDLAKLMVFLPEYEQEFICRRLTKVNKGMQYLIHEIKELGKDNEKIMAQSNGGMDDKTAKVVEFVNQEMSVVIGVKDEFEQWAPGFDQFKKNMGTKEDDIKVLESIIVNQKKPKNFDLEKLGFTLLNTNRSQRNAVLTDIERRNYGVLEPLKKTMKNILSGELAYAHASLDGSNGRLFKHRYEVSLERLKDQNQVTAPIKDKYDGLQGDALKTAALQTLRTELTKIDTIGSLDHFKEIYKEGVEYKILQHAQGFLTRKMNLKTDSVTALEFLIKEKEREINAQSDVMKELGKDAVIFNLGEHLQTATQSYHQWIKSSAKLDDKYALAKYLVDHYPAEEVEKMIKNIAENNYALKGPMYLRTDNPFVALLARAYVEKYDGENLIKYYNDHKGDPSFYEKLGEFEFSDNSKNIIQILGNIHNSSIDSGKKVQQDSDPEYDKMQKAGMIIKIVAPIISSLVEPKDQVKQIAIAQKIGDISNKIHEDHLNNLFDNNGYTSGKSIHKVDEGDENEVSHRIMGM